jgi:hypothetical protein
MLQRTRCELPPECWLIRVCSILYVGTLYRESSRTRHVTWPYCSLREFSWSPRIRQPAQQRSRLVNEIDDVGIPQGFPTISADSAQFATHRMSKKQSYDRVNRESRGCNMADEIQKATCRFSIMRRSRSWALSRPGKPAGSIPRRPHIPRFSAGLSGRMV